MMTTQLQSTLRLMLLSFIGVTVYDSYLCYC